MNKNESRYFNTAILFQEALIHLLEKKDIEYITVKEICAKAGVNRSTFYLHYESINDLIEDTMNYINEKFIDFFNEDCGEFIKRIKTCSLDDLKLIEKRYLTPYLNFIKDNKKIFRAAFNNPKGMRAEDKYKHLKKYILVPILERFNVAEKDRSYLLSFYISGIMAVIREWLNGDCKDSTDEIEEIIIKCVGVN
ncbi:MAG: TetR/AcrR family transcriptional regulator [Acutalibacteraceae bacterium]